ncbi:Response regulator receiver domain-containing protein [Paenibacillus sp. 1_12]|uniref:response regulator transcription factor n=1 Tax=Paenibacillus sp. 1_12 TaxID=1566278 RepID=UPI0008F21646|nr:response regulator transcription factor [Paenibacillus sp. 1_12]SFL72721.1 Response regulator receiver domain-containing protein [Paenibacillus sp. 1_12]
MNMSVLIQNDLTNLLYEQVTEQLLASGHSKCGLILAHSSHVGSIELQDLETRLRMEDSTLSIQTSYEPKESLLIVVLPVQPLSYTHFLSLLIKDFLQRAGLLEGPLTVASFPESAVLNAAAISEMIAMTNRQDTIDREIRVFHRHIQVEAAPSIVMIDQNTDLLDFLSARLSHRGYDVRPALDGMEGLQLINETPPDLVITELNLPALDGYQLIHRIRQSRALKNQCKIMVLTDLGLEQEFSKCFDLGVSDILTKPFSPIELEARIHRLLA